MHIFTAKKILSLGARGEKAAAAYLIKKGYVIVATNFCNQSGRRLGEIDIIAKQGGELVFVEVKTRTAPSAGLTLPEENINRAKLYKLNKAATFYLRNFSSEGQPYRFDAITLVVNLDGLTAELRHLKNIFF